MEYKSGQIVEFLDGPYKGLTGEVLNTPEGCFVLVGDKRIMASEFELKAVEPIDDPGSFDPDW